MISPHKVLAIAALSAAVTSHQGSCVARTGGRHGALWIHIVSPSSTGSYTTAMTTVGVGGDVGGWSIFDPTPTIRWRNEATGEEATIGQSLGTFATGQIGLAPGPNTIRVRASNGAQKQAQDSIVVFRTP